MASLADELAPSEIWDLVKVLSDKLKATRDQLRVIQVEKEELQGRLDEVDSATVSNENDTGCDTASCSSAAKVKELKKKVKMMRKEHLEQLTERDQRIDDLQRQVTSEGTVEVEHPEAAVVLQTSLPSTMLQTHRTASPARPVQETLEEVTIIKSEARGLERRSNTPARAESEEVVIVKEEGTISKSLPKLPNWTSLRPCLRTAHRLEDTTSSIPPNVLRLSKAEEPLYCHTHILWKNDVPQEAYLIRPSHLYNHLELGGRRWTKNRDLDNYARGRSREIFYLTDHHVHYAGTYICDDVKAIKQADYGVIVPGTISQEMQLQSLIHSLALSPAQRAQAHDTVYDDYTRGHRKLYCVTFRFTSFNERLYQELVALYTRTYPNDAALDMNSLKRKHSEGSAASSYSNRRRTTVAL